MRSFPLVTTQKALSFSDETFGKFAGVQETVARAHQKLDIVYEDDNILLINKPVGMLSQPADDKEPSLVEYLTGYLLESRAVTEASFTYLSPICLQSSGPQYQRTCGCGEVPGKDPQELSLLHDRSFNFTAW